MPYKLPASEWTDNGDAFGHEPKVLYTEAQVLQAYRDGLEEAAKKAAIHAKEATYCDTPQPTADYVRGYQEAAEDIEAVIRALKEQA